MDFFRNYRQILGGFNFAGQGWEMGLEADRLTVSFAVTDIDLVEVVQSETAFGQALKTSDDSESVSEVSDPIDELAFLRSESQKAEADRMKAASELARVTGSQHESTDGDGAGEGAPVDERATGGPTEEQRRKARNILRILGEG
jgi:hypothetical protein